MRRILSLFGLIMALTHFSLLAQSGWTREKGNLFLKTDLQFFSSDQYFNLSGNLLNTNTFRQQSWTLYGEYGLTDRLALNAGVPLFRLNSFETTEAVGGFGDLQLELKYAVSKGAVPIAISIAPEFPTGKHNHLATNKTNNFERINLPSGDGEFNIWSTVAVSHSFYPAPVYVSGFTSYNYRTKFEGRSFQDQMRSGVEVGVKVKKAVWLNGKLVTQYGVGDRPVIADFIRGDGTTYTGYSLGAYYEFGKHLGLSLQYFNYLDALVPRRNLYSAGAFSIGVAYTRKR